MQYLEYRQYQILQHEHVPQTLKAVVSQKVHDDSQNYSRAKVNICFLFL